MSASNGIRILGIDPGLATVGFGMMTVCPEQAFNKGDTPRWGIISTQKHKSDSQRLQEIYEDLSALLNELRPDCVSLEKLFFFKNAKTMVPVSQARGVILLAIHNYGAPVFEYTPMQVKQAITGYGKSPKPEIQEMLIHILGLPYKPTPDDAADALAMAYCHYQFEGRLNRREYTVTGAR